MKLKIIYLLTFLSILNSSCTDYSNQIYVDDQKKAIISCNRNILKEVDIDGPDFTVEYEGVDTIFFNRKNFASCITVGLKTNNDYVLNLKPNSSYDIKSYVGNGDQGPYGMILRTDGKGNIIHDDQNNCR